MKHCSGALSPTINQLATSFIASSQHALSAHSTNKEQHVSEVRGDKHTDLVRLADTLNKPAESSSSIHSHNGLAEDASFNKSSALHALSNFMLPMGHQPFGLTGSLHPNGSAGPMFPSGAVYNGSKSLFMYFNLLFVSF
jgi:hypothetical protein